MKPATFFQRFIAYIADNLILLAVWIGVQVVIGLDVENGGKLMTIINLLVSTGYFVYFHARYGATPGKRLMELRVLSIDDKPISFLQSFVRYSPYSAFIGMQIFLVIDVEANTLSPVAQLFFAIVLIWHMLSVFLILNRPDRRTTHDLVAYTQVLYIPRSQRK